MSSTRTAPDTLFVADNIALDFLNTEYGVGEQRQDCLRDDEDVLTWLESAGLLAAQDRPEVFDGLLAQVHALRSNARAVLDRNWIETLRISLTHTDASACYLLKRCTTTPRETTS